MADPADNLSPKQHKAIAALMSSPTIAQAAQAANVGERTLYAWLNEPAFNAAYRAARHEALGQAIARAHQDSGDMITVLIDIARDAGAPKSVRVAAASKVLDFAVRAGELEDIAARLAALEAAYGKA